MNMWWSRRPRRRELERQLTELNHSLREVSDKLSEHRVQVNVQRLHVDQATLEQLVFRLDSLDIKELSGSLNLGNNFGQVPSSVKSTRKAAQAKPDTQKPEGEVLDKGWEANRGNYDREAEKVNFQSDTTGANALRTDAEHQVEHTKKGFSVRF